MTLIALLFPVEEAVTYSELWPAHRRGARAAAGGGGVFAAARRFSAGVFRGRRWSIEDAQRFVKAGTGRAAVATAVRPYREKQVHELFGMACRNRREAGAVRGRDEQCSSAATSHAAGVPEGVLVHQRFGDRRSRSRAGGAGGPASAVLEAMPRECGRAMCAGRA